MGRKRQQYDAFFFLPDGTLFACGYNRIVYGDHGPYVEFEAEQIRLTLLKRFPDPQKPGIFYVWMYPQNHWNVKVYYQIKDVRNLRNAPKRPDGVQSGYDRQEGYADYIVGKYYVSPDSFQVKRE